MDSLTPEGGASGMAWAEGSLCSGDSQTGAIMRTIVSNRFVTGVTWVDDELWHGTWEADQSELRRIGLQSGEVLEQIDMPPDIMPTSVMIVSVLLLASETPTEPTDSSHFAAVVAEHRLAHSGRKGAVVIPYNALPISRLS